MTTPNKPVSVELYRFVRTQTRKVMRQAGYKEDAISSYLENQVTVIAEMNEAELAAQMLMELPSSAFHIC